MQHSWSVGCHALDDFDCGQHRRVCIFLLLWRSSSHGLAVRSSSHAVLEAFFALSARFIVLVSQSVSAIGFTAIFFAPSCELANPDTDDFRASALEQ